MLKATARKKPIAPPPKPLLAIFPLLFIQHWLLPTSSIFYFQIFTKNPLVASSFLPYKEVFMRHFLQRRPFGSAFQNVELLASHLKKNEKVWLILLPVNTKVLFWSGTGSLELIVVFILIMVPTCMLTSYRSWSILFKNLWDLVVAHLLFYVWI